MSKVISFLTVETHKWISLYVAIYADKHVLIKHVRFTLMLRTLSALMKPTRRRTLFMRFSSSFITRPWCCTHNQHATKD